MGHILRPFLLVTIVSFLLGLWLSLRKGEQTLLARMRESLNIVILTDQPQWWKAIVEKARQDGVAEIELLHPRRRGWSDVLESANAKCDLVTTKSYFLRHFLTNHWLDQVPKAPKWHELLHPDFQGVFAGVDSNQFVPLLWSVTVWNVNANQSRESQLQIKTSTDEALLTAIDLRDIKEEDFFESAEDDQDNAEKLWSAVQDRVDLSYDQPPTNVPLKPIRAVQEFLTEFQEPTQRVEMDELFQHQDLWTWGIGACPGHGSSPAVSEFLNWLIEPDNVGLLAHESGLALTITSAEHLKSSNLRPSNLRRFNLERIRRRELSWNLSAAWEDLISQKASR